MYWIRKAKGIESNYQRYCEAYKCLKKYDFPGDKQKRSGIFKNKGQSDEGN